MKTSSLWTARCPSRLAGDRAAVRAARAAARALLLAAVAAALAGAADGAPPAAAGRSATLEVRPAPAPAAGPLADWHRRYLPHAAPVRAALRRLWAARQEADPTDYKRRYRHACQLLGDAVAPFLDPARRDALYPRADDDAAARYHLRRAYAGLARASALGADSRFQEAEIAFAEAGRWFRQAARVLERYGLEP